MNAESQKMFDEIRPRWNWWRRAERAFRRRFRMAPSDAERLEFFQQSYLFVREEKEHLFKTYVAAPAISRVQQEWDDMMARIHLRIPLEEKSL